MSRPHPSALARFLGIQPPESSPREWHVSPQVDMLAYHWSWLWALVPLALLAGNTYPHDYRFALALVLAGNFTHQAVSLAFVYLDPETFRRHRWRFTIFPALILVLFAATIVGYVLDKENRFSTLRPVYTCVALASYTWNFWHVYMQKFGILRLYDAKRGAAGGSRVPRWVDLWVVWAWLPLYFAILPSQYADQLYKSRPLVADHLRPSFEWLVTHQHLTQIPCWLIVAGSWATFLVHEWRASRWTNMPRLSMAAGTTALGSALILFDLPKAIIAFGVSHVVEYIVFVWAFQRRYYHAPMPHRPLLQRFLTYPATSFAVFCLGVGGAYYLLANWTRIFFARPDLAGIPLSSVIGFFSIYLAFIHFYYDGFLWKMRRPLVRSSI